jgi:hypothetical protein
LLTLIDLHLHPEKFPQQLSLKRIIPVLLLAAFLAPGAGKTLHQHHDHLFSHLYNGQSTVTENCQLCSFEFYAFSINTLPVFNLPERHPSAYFCPDIQPGILIAKPYSFLLRAPPCQ